MSSMIRGYICCICYKGEPSVQHGFPIEQALEAIISVDSEMGVHSRSREGKLVQGRECRSRRLLVPGIDLGLYHEGRDNRVI